MNKKNHYLFLLFSSLTVLLNSCTGGPALIGFPYDPGGRSLNSPSSDTNPQISGRYIVFISDRRGSQDVYLFDVVERNLIDLPGLNSLDMIPSHPSVSANGLYIVFAGSRQGKSSIYLYDVELRQLRNLTENLAAEVRNPTISADSNIIAFETSENGQWDIVLCDKTGQRINE